MPPRYFEDLELGYLDDYDPEDYSITRPSDVEEYEFGVPSPYADRAMVLESQQAKAEDNAMQYLRQSLKQSADVSMEQGIATALLAAIPTLGGYMIGKSVGQPKLPEGYFEAGGTRAAIGLDKVQTGANAGALSGLEAGYKAGTGYLNSLEADQKQKNEVYQKMASAEINRASRLETRANSLMQAGINKQMELEMMPLREQSQMRLQNNAAQNTMDRQLELDRLRSDREKIPAELITKEVLTEQDLKSLTTEQLNALTRHREALRRQQGQDFKQEQTLIPGYRNMSKAQLNPTIVNKISEQNLGVAKTTQLLEQYLQFPDDLTGDSSAVQAAIQGMLVNAQRQATGSGANFTATEIALVKQALIASKAGDLDNWVKRNALGRDQRVFANTLINLYQKTQDYALADGLGQFREDVPPTYYPPKILRKWGLPTTAPQSKAEIQARIDALLAKGN